MLQRNDPPRPRLLALDEDRIILQSLGQFLRREGYEVRTTDRPDDAIAILEAGQAELLLADVKMAGLKPAEFLRDVRRRFPHVVVVVITGYGSIEGAVEATKNGAFDYLTKPIVDEEIKVVVEKAARQQSLLFENHSLRQQLDLRFGLENVVGHDHRMLKVFDLVQAVADNRTTVLMTGESGTGKSLLARAIHHRSPRRDKPFVEVSCGALPETLLESELFGHTKGAFTGAVAPRRGLFEEAAGGTLFLDEIATVSPSIQVKLLRVLQERKIQRVGGGTPVSVDFRLIAACNVRLEDEVEAGRFREDLFYRLNVFPIHVPPLRERAGDVPLLAEHFRRRVGRENGVEPPEISPQALARMTEYDWPGNVRELENFVERAAILHAGAATLPFEPPRGARAEPERDLSARARRERWTLERLEREHILQVLEDTGGNQVRAAEVLGIDRRTLHRKLKQYRGVPVD